MPNTAKRSRQVLLWLHVLSSVAWMSQALGMLVLLLERDAAATAAAHLLDTTVLVACANMSAASGFLLSATTPWGFFLHRWVAVKFVITVAQLFVGIVVLSPMLNAAGAQPPVQLVTTTAAMVLLIAFQGWLSVAKPWGRRPGAAKPPPPRRSISLLAPVALVGDVGVFVLLGQPAPILSLLVVIAALVSRAVPVKARGSLRSTAPQLT